MKSKDKDFWLYSTDSRWVERKMYTLVTLWLDRLIRECRTTNMFGDRSKWSETETGELPSGWDMLWDRGLSL